MFIANPVADGRGVDEDDMLDRVRPTVEHHGARQCGSAGDDQDTPLSVRIQRGGDELGVVLQRDLAACGVVRLEPGKGQRDDRVPAVDEQRRDLVPGPSAEPEIGNEDDPRGHARIVPAGPASPRRSSR